MTSLIFHLAIKEIERVTPLVGISVSDFAAQARFLRAIAAATPFDSEEIGDDPGIDALLHSCSNLWQMFFYREMIDDLKRADLTPKIARRRQIAALMSLLGAMQLETIYLDQAEERIHNLFGRFSREVIEPRLGLSVNDVLAGFRFLREEIPKRLQNARVLMDPMHQEWLSFKQLPKQSARTYKRGAKRDDPQREKIARSFSEGIRLMNRFLVVTTSDLQPHLRGLKEGKSPVCCSLFTRRPRSLRGCDPNPR